MAAPRRSRRRQGRRERADDGQQRALREAVNRTGTNEATREECDGKARGAFRDLANATCCVDVHSRRWSIDACELHVRRRHGSAKSPRARPSTARARRPTRPTRHAAIGLDGDAASASRTDASVRRARAPPSRAARASPRLDVGRTPPRSRGRRASLATRTGITPRALADGLAPAAHWLRCRARRRASVRDAKLAEQPALPPASQKARPAHSLTVSHCSQTLEPPLRASDGLHHATLEPPEARLAHVSAARSASARPTRRPTRAPARRCAPRTPRSPRRSHRRPRLFGMARA